MNKIPQYTLIFILLLSVSVSSIIFANADVEKEELNVIEKKIEEVKNLFSQGEKKEKDMLEQIDVIDKEIDGSEKEIESLQSGINATFEKVQIAQKELDETQERIDVKNESFNERLRAIYKNGEAGYIEIMLGSDSFSDFMNNAEMVNRIYQYDVDFLENLKKQYKEIDVKKKDLEGYQNELVAKRRDVEDKQEQLEVSRGEAVNLRKEIANNNDLLAAQEKKLAEYADELIDKIKSIQSDEDYAGGVFAWPSPGYTRITSPFGYRIHPILKTKIFHTGTDIGVPANSKIVAVNEGTVIMAGWSGGYGKVVVIDHGGGIVTLYAHNNKLLVKKGDQVRKGQQISLSGSTGMSTGPHLHFEVRKDGAYIDSMIYLKE